MYPLLSSSGLRNKFSRLFLRQLLKKKYVKLFLKLIVFKILVSTTKKGSYITLTVLFDLISLIT